MASPMIQRCGYLEFVILGILQVLVVVNSESERANDF